jgi:hypothetical protein
MRLDWGRLSNARDPSGIALQNGGRSRNGADAQFMDRCDRTGVWGTPVHCADALQL